MLNSDFSAKGLGLVSSTHFVYDFSTKMFLILYSVSSQKFIVYLALRLEILGNSVLLFVSHFVTSWILKLILAPSHQPVFLDDPKSQNKNLNIFRKKRAFQMK